MARSTICSSRTPAILTHLPVKRDAHLLPESWRTEVLRVKYLVQCWDLTLTKERPLRTKSCGSDLPDLRESFEGPLFL